MKKVVVIGGGTGLSTLLRGLKTIDNISLSAIVTVADNGGSTGKIRKEYAIPAVGDLRQVIVSMSKDENIFNELMQYRFKTKKENVESSLGGHSLGNLIITALIDMEGDFYKGIERINDIFNTVGKIFPITDYRNLQLSAKYVDKTICLGEEHIPNTSKKIDCVYYENTTLIKPNHQAIEALENADYIILGIGSLYTSIIANLIIPGVKEAIVNNKDAQLIYVANVMTQPGETDNMSLQQHIGAIDKHLDGNWIDQVVVNTSTISPNLLKKYEAQNAYPVIVEQKLEREKYKIIEAKLIDSNNNELLRHHPKMVHDAFIKILV